VLAQRHDHLSEQTIQRWGRINAPANHHAEKSVIAPKNSSPTGLTDHPLKALKRKCPKMGTFEEPPYWHAARRNVEVWALDN
jgi:hypothetical protein